MNINISAIRQDYTKASLDITDVNPDPLKQFKKWFEDVVNAKADEVNAFVLSTLNKEGHPSSRVVLLKELTDEGFVFFTNYESNKGAEIANHPYAAINFFWKELERQVRIEGKVVKVSAESSDTYYNSRPESSRIGAWASPQSKVIESREFLEEQEKNFTGKFKGMAIPRPAHWGGYCIVPAKIEFWQGRASRLHDRILYTKTAQGWQLDRLAP